MFGDVFVPLPLDNVGNGVVFLVSSIPPSVRSPSQMLLPRYVMNGLNRFDETDREYC